MAMWLFWKLRFFEESDEIRNVSQAISDATAHCRRHAQCSVNLDGIVLRGDSTQLRPQTAGFAAERFVALIFDSSEDSWWNSLVSKGAFFCVAFARIIRTEETTARPRGLADIEPGDSAPDTK